MATPTPLSSPVIPRPTHAAHTPSSSLGHLELSASVDGGSGAHFPSLNGHGANVGHAHLTPGNKGRLDNLSPGNARREQNGSDPNARPSAERPGGVELSSPTSPKLRKRRSASVSLVVPAPHVPQLDALIEAEDDEVAHQQTRAPPPSPESPRKRSPKKATRGTYIAPHLRSGGSPSYALKTLSLNSLDNSALPEPEDNFYSHPPVMTTRPRSWTNSSMTSLGTPVKQDENHSSSAGGRRYSSGTPSRKQTNPYSYESSPPPAMSLINRGPYVNPDKFAHPRVIEEGDEDELESDAPQRRSRMSSCSTQLHLAESRRASIVDPSFVEDRFADEESASGDVEGEDVCTSCGAEAVASFVALMPCDHLLCHVCVNALINAAAHKPPRPLDCFFCGGFVESFLPAWEGVGVPDPESSYDGQRIGLVEALFLAYKSQRQEHARACANSPKKGGDGGGRRKGKEPVSLADLSRTFADHLGPLQSSPQSVPLSQRSRWDFSSPGTAAMDLFNSPMSSMRGTPSDQLITAREALAASSPDSSRVQRSSGGRPSRSNSISGVFGHSADASFVTALPELEGDTSFAFSALDDGPTTPANRSISFDQVNVTIEAKPSEWPIVRLDNIPWDVTTAEVEEWLPSGTLPSTDECVLAVHILCNRSDGRTLNQCYVEAASLEAARRIVRSRDGRKLRKRPVHVTLNGPGEFLTTIFPTYDPGFTGTEANKSGVTCPVLMQTELTGLLTLCKLQSSHSYKVSERAYFNIVTIIQKFPWYQPDTYNSQQIVRLFNTASAAVEILAAVRAAVPEWLEILSVLVEAVMACPVFRPAQKSKFLRKAGVPYPAGGLEKPASPNSFTPPALQERYVGVSGPHPPNSLSLSRPVEPSFFDSVDIDEGEVDEDDSFRASASAYRPSAPFVSANWRAPSVHKIREANQTSTDDFVEEHEEGELKRRHRRSSSSIARELGVDRDMIRAVALQLGLRG